MKKIATLILTALLITQFGVIPNQSVVNAESTPIFNYEDKGVIQDAFGEVGDYYYSGDFDGDGLEDIMVSTERVDYNQNVDRDLAWYFMKGTGNGFTDGGQWNSSYGVATDNYYVADFNGDGKDDLLISTTRIDYNKSITGDLAWYLMISNGSTFSDGGRINDSFGLNQDEYIVSDYNDDGRDDLYIYTTRGTGSNMYNWYGMLNNGTKFLDDHQFTTGFGNTNTTFVNIPYYFYVKESNTLVNVELVLGFENKGNGLVGTYVISPVSNDIHNTTHVFDSVDIPLNIDFNVNTAIISSIANKTKINESEYGVPYYTSTMKTEVPLVGVKNGDGSYSWRVVFSDFDIINGASFAFTTISNTFGKTGDIIFTGQFDGKFGGDIVVGEEVNGKIRWSGLYSSDNVVLDFDYSYTNVLTSDVYPTTQEF